MTSTMIKPSLPNGMLISKLPEIAFFSFNINKEIKIGGGKNSYQIRSYSRFIVKNY